MDTVRGNNWGWRSMRAPVSAKETALADYGPARLTAELEAKMVCVSPATAIVIRGFGLDAANEQVDALTFSGWCFKTIEGSTSPGQILWRGTAILGASAWATAGIPHTRRPGRGGWNEEQWLEVDTWTAPTYNYIKAQHLNSTDETSCMILPTLGYTHILAEICEDTSFTVAQFGLVWRPLGYDNGVLIPTLGSD